MNKQAIKKVVQSELAPFLTVEGYRPARVPADMISVMEKDTTGVSYQFSCHVYKYQVYSLDYGFSLGFPQVTELLQLIHDRTPIRNEMVTAPKFITGVSPVLLGDPLQPGKHQPPFATEVELAAILRDVQSFYANEFARFSREYGDIEGLNSAINNLDNFREKENGVFPPLVYFFVTRLIIARLARHPHYEQVVERNFDALEKEWARFDASFDRTDDKRPEVFAAKFLRDFVV